MADENAGAAAGGGDGGGGSLLTGGGQGAGAGQGGGAGQGAAGAKDGGTQNGTAANGAANGGAPEWMGGLSEANRSALAAKGYESPDALASAYVAAEKKLGQRGLTLPGADAKPEDWAPVWNALGRPETPEGYAAALKDFERPDGWNGEAETAFLKQAHEMGLNGGQARKALEIYRDHVSAMLELAAAEKTAGLEQATTALRQAWGSGFDDGVNEARVATRAIADAALGKDAAEFKQFLDQSGLGDHPAMARVMRFLGKQLQIGEDGTLQGAAAATMAGMSPERAQAEIKALEQAAVKEGNAHPLWNRDHPEHKATVEKRDQLYAVAFPGNVAGTAPAEAT